MVPSVGNGKESPVLKIVRILKSLMVPPLVDARGFGSRGSARVVRSALHLCLSLHDSESGVVVRIGFIVRAIVGDTLDYNFGIVAAGEGAFGVSPILFGLAFVTVRDFPLAFPIVAYMPLRFGRVFVDREIAERVGGVA